jgi:hypothetical protein
MTHPTAKSSPAWSFPGKQPTQKTLEVPGPGTYQKVSQEKSKAVKFGNSERGRLLGNVSTPGPGTYSFDSP